LRTSAVAPWLGLALPRILLRLPYGQKTDPIDSFAFEEMPGGRDPEAYLWGNPAYVCARLIAAAFAENGWDFSPGDVLELGDCPAHVYEDAGERRMQPATEILLSERATEEILAHGPMPLLGHRQRNAIRLARFQSLADPPMALAGAWRP
jgi:type VI secretion system protein ImpC